jgi:hypothetical protein
MKILCATALTVLFLLPFTAPFSTRDLTGSPFSSTPAAIASAANAIPPPAIRISGRIRIEALSALHTIAHAPVPVLRAHKRAVDSSGRLVSASSLATVLRL